MKVGKLDCRNKFIKICFGVGFMRLIYGSCITLGIIHRDGGSALKIRIFLEKLVKIDKGIYGSSEIIRAIDDPCTLVLESRYLEFDKMDYSYGPWFFLKIIKRVRRIPPTPKIILDKGNFHERIIRPKGGTTRHRPRS